MRKKKTKITTIVMELYCAKAQKIVEKIFDENRKVWVCQCQICKK